MKLNLELIAELLQNEVLRLRAESKRQVRGGTSSLFDMDRSSIEQSLAEQTFNPPKNLASDGAVEL